jgi:hypothetical protein
MSECLTANEAAIKLRGDHKLRQARDQALVCSASSCPGEVREACQKRVTDLVAAIPTVVFLAKDAEGHDVIAVKVSMDGEPVGDRLDGTPIPVDPGQHKFTFRVAGQPPTDQSFIVSEGQKNWRETITLGKPAMPPLTSPTPAAGPSASASTPLESVAVASSPGTGQRIAGIVLGAAGVVGLGLGAVFGGVAASDWSSAKQACAGQPASCTTSASSPGYQEEGSATTMATLSTVSFVAGGALAAGGIIVFFTAPKRPSSEAHTSASGVELVPTGGPGGAGMTIRGWF